MKLLERIANELNMPIGVLDYAIKKSRTQVKHIKIEKRNKSERSVYLPSKKLKVIQYWLINNVFAEMKIHESATAYKERTSIKDNAIKHQKGTYFLKLDFKNFFPSLEFHDFKKCLDNWFSETIADIDRVELYDIIRKSCFYKHDMLPIGYPSSPIISNIIMFDFDLDLVSLLSDVEKYGEVAYTRYADDLIFSTDLKGACKEIKSLVDHKLDKMTSPKLILNNDKTKFVSSLGGSSMVTGLRICHDGHITIHRKYKDRVRLLLSLFRKGDLVEQDYSVLKGHLAYIRHVDARFYTKLHNKFFKEIKRLLEL